MTLSTRNAKQKSTGTETMSLALPSREMEVLDNLAATKGMSKSAILRQALRLYQLVDHRTDNGYRMVFQAEDGTIRSEGILL